MSVYAYVVKNKVINVLIADQSWVMSQPDKDLYYESTEQNPIIGDSVLLDGVFYPPQPFPSWTRADGLVEWSPPTPKPAGNGTYRWDEETLSWMNFTIIEPSKPYPDDDSKMWVWDKSLDNWVEYNE